MPDIKIPSLAEIKAANKEALAEVIREELPKIVKKATQKDYYTTSDLKELYGFSKHKQKYMRDEQGLQYVQSGRKILYPVEAFDNWCKEHSRNIEEV